MNHGASITYYDGILLAIGGSLVAGILIGVLSAFPVQVGVLVGSLVATVFVYDAIFRNPPKPAPSSRATAGAVVWHVYLVVLLATTMP